ncbi:MAG: hypothetical protein RL189_2121 [Pseudomonadota bacterium]|jgi:hypothetical protein
MASTAIENIINKAKDDPQSVLDDVERLFVERTERHPTLKLLNDSAERFSREWQLVCEMRTQVDEGLLQARKIYREVLKKTESAALLGKPRLYWLAKFLFVDVRKKSLEYQLREADYKIAALNDARARLQLIMSQFNLKVSPENLELLNNRESAEARSKKHAVDLQVEWEKASHCSIQNRELRERVEIAEIRQALTEASLTTMLPGTSAEDCSRKLRAIDSPRQLTSALPHVGFSNRIKLMKLIEQSEHAALHAEQDLHKVRDGLACAREAAVDGRTTSVTREWLDYCKTIVSRYE